MPKREQSDDCPISSGDDNEYLESSKKRKTSVTQMNKKGKRRKGSITTEMRKIDEAMLICRSLAELDVGSDSQAQGFDEAMQDLIPSLLDTREKFLRSQAEVNQLGQKLRPLTVSETGVLMQSLQEFQALNDSSINRLLLRKFKLEKHRRLHHLSSPRFSISASRTLKAPDPPASYPQPDPEVINALVSIRTTPYEKSLAARITGFSSIRPENGYIFRDWEARTPWMDLMDDIHEHHLLMHPEREQARRPAAPIDYQSLRSVHLPQVHDLLSRTFWPSIDVSDSLQYSPEQCTIVVTYRHLVVGVAILSSPQETYITYLAVRTGWENSQIATKMLYTLIARNPRRDILLHVSADNPAMLLYNRFGFKAEEFVVGFYEDYLDSQSRASKNAFRLRLRR